MPFISILIGFLVILLIAVAGLALSGIRFIPNNRIGIVEKRFGQKSVQGGFIALENEAGYQPEVLRGGLHYLMPIQFVVHIAPLVTIPQGKIGYVFARDGQPLSPMQTLASNTTANNFEDVRAFLNNGGQKGPQRQILREGTYAINLAQFIVITEERVYLLPLSRAEETVIQSMTSVIAERRGFSPIVIKDSDDLVGIVTVHDGPSLPAGEIIAPIVGEDPANNETYHNNFQMPDRFLKAGGLRGRQLQVLVEGTYYLNRLFSTVQMIPKTIVEVGMVGVVVSYNGTAGEDLSGAEYRHGELVQRGFRGVWSEPMLPGKYAFNTYAGKMVMVPTTNVILKWIRSEVGSHKFDENLTEVSLITKDAFEPSLPLSVVIHIDYKKAPLVIQRFGDVKSLIEQTLDPMVSAYFKNIGQTRTLIQLIQERSEIQNIASQEMKEKFSHYNLELEEVLIGTPGTDVGDEQIEMILNQLRSRQIAVEQVETYSRQQTAAAKERELRETQARAEQQRNITESELGITVQSNYGKAEYQRALQQAAQIRTMAEAESERIARTGIAQAIAIEEQVAAYGGPQFQVTQQVLTRFAEAVQAANIDVVPRVVVNSGGEGGSASSSNVMEGLLTLLLSDKLGVDLNKTAPRKTSPEADRLREQIRQSMTENRNAQPPAGPAPQPKA
ncbi:MAG TPA: SPFH domain-containing protein [Anaerolineaceae bacterium]|nr:SPFH domain-containing protein [Anaerolineaceae bacterium]HPN51899.1 SPFH domain-containing protein [Anaerolineaceae bacterium]